MPTVEKFQNVKYGRFGLVYSAKKRVIFYKHALDFLNCNSVIFATHSRTAYQLLGGLVTRKPTSIHDP